MLSSIGRQYRCAVTLAIFSSFLLATSLYGQGVAASVTSHGFGGHAGAPGVRASVTSHGSFAPNHPVVHPVRPPFGCCGTSVSSRHSRPTRDFRHSRRGFFPGTAVYGVPYYPYAYDDVDDYAEAPADNEVPNQNDAYGEYNGGPTVFDRRGPGPEYDPNEAKPAETSPADDSSSASSQPEPEPAAPSTVLVFRDGHQLEIANYAIVGDTLFDLTPGHSRRVPLSELDVNATQKQNDDRGTDFRLPTNPQGS